MSKLREGFEKGKRPILINCVLIRCLINGGGGGADIFLKFNRRVGQNKWRMEGSEFQKIS